MTYFDKIENQKYLEDPFDFALNELLGAYLCTNIDNKFTVGRITELEVYLGDCDKACHAYKNKLTDRTATMFKKGGCAYVFLVYGMYSQFNVVVSEEGNANAILIRSIEPIEGIKYMQERRKTENIKNLTTGPGKLCQAMGITDKDHDGINLDSDLIWISPKTQNVEYVSSIRIGVDYAGEDKNNLWRYYISGNEFISKK